MNDAVLLLLPVVASPRPPLTRSLQERGQRWQRRALERAVRRRGAAGGLEGLGGSSTRGSLAASHER